MHLVCNLILFVCVLTFAVYTLGADNAVSQAISGPYYRADGENDGVALMINVYWGTEYVLPMLDVLDEYGARCTFFVGGSWAAAHGDVLSEIISRGHEVGNHGYSHLDHARLTPADGQKEIQKCENKIFELTGVKTTLFAPPSGAVNESVVRQAQNLGYNTIMWTKDTIDWRDKNAEIVLKRATNGIKAGDFVLMHPTAHTLEALPKILAQIYSQNLRAKTVSQCLNVAT